MRENYRPYYEDIVVHPEYNKLNNNVYQIKIKHSKAKVMPWLSKLKEVEDLIESKTPSVADVFKSLTSFNNILHKTRVGSFDERYERQILTEEKTEELLKLITVPAVTTINVTGIKDGDKLKEGKVVSLTFNTDPTTHNDYVCVSSNPFTADVTSTGELMCKRPGITILTFYHIFDSTKRKEIKIEVTDKTIMQRIR